METPHFIIHHEGDSCAVAVVEGIEKHQSCKVWNMATDDFFDIQVLHNIPIGHKIALQKIAKNDSVIKYGVDIGKCVAEVEIGGHLHTHNLKTKRW